MNELGDIIMVVVVVVVLLSSALSFSVSFLILTSMLAIFFLEWIIFDYLFFVIFVIFVIFVVCLFI